MPRNLVARVLLLMRTLGNDGAVANARALHDQRHREEWQVRSLRAA